MIGSSKTTKLPVRQKILKNLNDTELITLLQMYGVYRKMSNQTTSK